ncbi:MAG: hypothetical protein IJV80_06350, partial [Clostridia bacterium]|nr:hypothetical protein [Clostridia bacterium]
VDGTQVHTISLLNDANSETDMWSRLGDAHGQGGFAVIANGVTIDITSFKVTDAIRRADEHGYAADLSSGLPTEWTLDTKSAVSETTLTSGAGVVSLGHSGAGSINQYYGAKLDFDVGNYTDFIVEITFEMASAVDSSRWVGLMYHTQKDADGYTSGYMQNYRQNSRTASSVVVGGASGVSFNDFNDRAADATDSLDTLDAGEQHTMRIWTNGSLVYTYMDDYPTKDYGYDMYNSSVAESTPVALLGGKQLNGSFSFIVNKSSVNITGLTVSGTKTPDEVGAMKTTDYTDLPFSPTVVLDVDSQEDMSTAKSLNTDSAIYTIDGNANVIGEDGQTITSLSTALYETKYTSLPIVRVESSEAADAFERYLQSSGTTDIAIMSSNYAILKDFRKNTTVGKSIRGILDWSASELTTRAQWQEVVQKTNEAWAHVAVLNEKSASREAVEYIQGRLKTVWVVQKEFSTFNTASLISTGAYGIITDNAKGVNDTFSLYKDDLNSLVRAPMNVAHRGVSYATENSLYGYQCAYNDGAVYFEIDTYITSDGHVVLMHNQTIDATTTCDIAGQYVEDMTYAQLSQYRIDTTVDGQKIAQTQPIPKLADLFSYFQDKDIVYAFEIKTPAKTENYARIVSAIRKIIEEYNLWDQIFFITFSSDILVELREQIPELPTAHLRDQSNETCCQLNCVEDLSGGSRAHTDYVKDRGYMSYCWTYYANNTDDAYVYYGSYGITTNYAQTLTENARFLDEVARTSTSSADYVASLDDLETSGYAMQFRSENRVTPVYTPVNAALHTYEKKDGYINAIFKATAQTKAEGISYTLYSKPVRFIDADYYMSVSELNALYGKSVDELTLADIPVLEASKLSYSLLTEEEQGQVVGTADQKIAAIQDKYVNRTVSVTFDSAKGSVTGVEAGTTYSKGQKLSVTITANEGFYISSVTVNGSAVFVKNRETFTTNLLVADNSSIVVVFAEEEDIIPEPENPPAPEESESSSSSSSSSSKSSSSESSSSKSSSKKSSSKSSSSSSNASGCGSALTGGVAIMGTLVAGAFITLLSKKKKN